MKLRSTTKMALQAALAILISEIISLSFHMERGYWTTLTAMAVTTQTWAENVKRSYERVIMTIFGGVVGTALYLILPPNETLIISMLLVFVFFTVYLIQIYHLLGIFSLTCFVVFLFAFIGNWTFQLLIARIFDTLLGVLIALFVSACILPVKTDVPNLFLRFYEKIKKTLIIVFKYTEEKNRQIAGSQRLILDFHSIKKNARAIYYELMLRGGNQKKFLTLLKQTASCTQCTIALIESYQWLSFYLSEQEKKRILTALNTTHHNLDALIKYLKNEGHEKISPPDSLREVVHRTILEHPEKFASLDSTALGFFNLMYFIIQLNEDLYQTYMALTSK
ncbi:FUSC family protein [Legionella israelensis]|uniref:FUSC family protein n=1 Tax=Legionella israelensis TaxID=454 RepID=UPI0011816AD3|nr:FUSC family protein [Legionella israelensis]QDP73242.1 FUSC family protein [Legionella israelensis]